MSSGIGFKRFFFCFFFLLVFACPLDTGCAVMSRDLGTIKIKRERESERGREGGRERESGERGGRERVRIGIVSNISLHENEC